MPTVRNSERLLVRPVKDMPNFYQVCVCGGGGGKVVARYGYQDKADHSDPVVLHGLLLHSLPPFTCTLSL